MYRPLTVALLAFSVAVSAPAGAQTRDVAVGRAVDWSAAETPGPARYRSGPFTLTFRGNREAGAQDMVEPTLTVETAGAAPVTLAGNPTPASSAHRVTVGRWDDRRHYVLFQSYSGGAHCCTSMKLILPEAGRLQVADLGEWNGYY